MRQRPISVTIFGILNIGLAMLGLIGVLISAFSPGANMMGSSGMGQMLKDPHYVAWTKIATPLDAIAAVALLAAGIGLLLMQNWGRIVSLIHAVFTILFSMASFLVVLTARPPVILLIASLMVSILSLVYPILLLIFMTRPKVVSAMNAPPPVA